MPRKSVPEKDIVVSASAPARRKSTSTSRTKRSVATRTEVPVIEEAPELSTHEQIALLAYSYWEARGCQGGSPEEDWLRAEQELAAAKRDDKASSASA